MLTMTFMILLNVLIGFHRGFLGKKSPTERIVGGILRRFEFQC